MAVEANARGHEVVRVYSNELTPEYKARVPYVARDLQWLATIDAGGEGLTVAETAAAVRHACGDREILAVICGSEPGVTLADQLSEHMGLLTNGSAIRRRDKCVQIQCCKAAMLRTPREAYGVDWSDVQSFAAKEQMPIIVKPVESAGSDGVRICSSLEEAEQHFNRLKGSQRQVGVASQGILLQEFLVGQEYVVDVVSRDGVHKVVMLYVYDKRPVNDAPFVYFEIRPMSPDSEIAKSLMDYTRKVLDAIGIKHGATHNEIIMTEDGPCLVECNCRPHGWDGSWDKIGKIVTGGSLDLATKTVEGGYSQVDASIDSFLDAEKFNRLPMMFPWYPSGFKGKSTIVQLVNMKEGIVKATPGLDRIKELSSFVQLLTKVQIGKKAMKTIDLITCLGQVVLIHPDPAIFDADYEFIRQMEWECRIVDVEDDHRPVGHMKELPSQIEMLSQEEKQTMPQDPMFDFDLLESHEESSELAAEPSAEHQASSQQKPLIGDKRKREEEQETQEDHEEHVQEEIQQQQSSEEPRHLRKRDRLKRRLRGIYLALFRASSCRLLAPSSQLPGLIRA